MDDPDRDPLTQEPIIEGDQVLELATPAMACGVVGLAIPGVNLAAIVMGIISVNKFEDEKHRPDDRRKAVTGIVLGVVGLLVQFLALLVGLIMMYLASQTVQQKPPKRTAVIQQVMPSVQVDELPAAPTPLPATPPKPNPPPKRSGNIYYFDLNTGQLFADKRSLIAPIAAPSDAQAGNATSGVKAYFFPVVIVLMKRSALWLGWKDIFLLRKSYGKEAKMQRFKLMVSSMH